MSKPMDLKTVKIFEPLKKKPPFETKIFIPLNFDQFSKVLSKNPNETVLCGLSYNNHGAIMLIVPLKITIVI